MGKVVVMGFRADFHDGRHMMIQHDIDAAAASDGDDGDGDGDGDDDDDDDDVEDKRDADDHNVGEDTKPFPQTVK